MSAARFFPLFFFLLGFGQISPITLSSLIEKARTNSDLLHSYALKIEAGQKAYEKDKLLELPQVTGYVTGEYNSSFKLSPGVEITFDLQKSLGKYSKASALDLEKTTLLEILASESISRQLSGLYLSLYILSDTQEIYKDGEDYFQNHIRDIKNIINRGVDARLDLARSEVTLNNIQWKRKILELEIEKRLLEINSMVRENFSVSDFSFADIRDHGPGKNPEKIFSDVFTGSSCSERDITGKIDEKMKQTLLWQVQNLDLKKSQNLADQSRYYYIPAVSLGAQYNVYQDQQSWDDPYRVYVALSIPISQVFNGKKEQEKAKKEYESQKNILKDYERGFSLNLGQIMESIRSSVDQFKIAENGLKKAREAIVLGAIQYQQGRIKEIDILDIYSQYLNASEQKLQTIYVYYLQNIELFSLLKTNSGIKTGSGENIK